MWKDLEVLVGHGSTTLWKEVVVGGQPLLLASSLLSNRTRGSGLKLHQGRFKLDTNSTLFYVLFERVVRCWNGLPMLVVELASLEAFKNCSDTVLRDMV